MQNDDSSRVDRDRLGACGLAAAGLVLVGVVLALRAAPAASVTAEAPSPAFKLLVAEDGVYRVRFEELVGAGLDPIPVASAGLGVTCAGKPVPIWVADGADGLFGPGDWLELVGRQLEGEGSYHDHYSGMNVYWLRLDHPSPARMTALRGQVPETTCDGHISPVWGELHLEEERVRAADLAERGDDPWQWARLTCVDQQPLQVVLELEDVDPGSTEPVSLAVHLLGCSRTKQRADGETEIADHRLELRLDGRQLAVAEWGGAKQEHLLRVDGLPASALAGGQHTLEISLPRRREPDGNLVPDAVYLDWVELHFPRRAWLRGEQAELLLERPAEGLCLETAADEPAVLYGSDGARVEGERCTGAAGSGAVQCFRGHFAAGRYRVASGRNLRRSYRVERDHPSDLTTGPHQADYLILSHPGLLAAVQPLAQLHRRQGLKVELVDVTDVYDELNHGVVHPRAIRDFLAFAYQHWERPAPRFVLLVGDASWDAWEGKGETRSTNPAEPAPDHRNLVPTWTLAARGELKASDSWFATVDPESGRPVMAVGRLPATEPEEVAAIVAKTIRQAEHPEPGPWRRSVLWISDSGRAADAARALAGELSVRGVASEKLLAEEGRQVDPDYRSKLLEAFDRGHLIVHFAGHGARFNWRTATPDYVHTNEVLRMSDLDLLQPRNGLPIVLAMTCSTAPFDHPTADSFGEKLLRLEGRGAVALFAPSGQAKATSQFLSRLLLESLLSEKTVGEALLRVKQETVRQELVEIFNLLGDPALPVALPEAQVELELVGSDPMTVRGRVWGREASDRFAGSALVEWVDEVGDLLASNQVPVEGAAFEARYGGDPAQLPRLLAVRAYVRAEPSGEEGIGGLRLRSEPVAYRRGTSRTPRPTATPDTDRQPGL